MKKTVSILTALLLAVSPVAQRAYAQEANVQAQQNVEESKASKVLGALKSGANKVVSGVKFAGNKACEGVKFAGQKVAEHPGVTAAVVLGSAALGGLGYLGYNTHSNWGKIVESYQNGDSFFSKIKDVLKLAFGVKIENETDTTVDAPKGNGNVTESQNNGNVTEPQNNGNVTESQNNGNVTESQNNGNVTSSENN